MSLSLELSCSLWLLALTQSSEQRQAFVQSTPDFRQEQSWLLQSFLQLQQSWDAISLGQGSLYPWTGWFFSMTSLQLYSSGFILFPCHAWTCESIYVAISTRICNIIINANLNGSLEFIIKNTCKYALIRCASAAFFCRRKASHMSNHFPGQLSVIQTAQQFDWLIFRAQI